MQKKVSSKPLVLTRSMVLELSLTTTLLLQGDLTPVGLSLLIVVCSRKCPQKIIAIITVQFREWGCFKKEMHRSDNSYGSGGEASSHTCMVKMGCLMQCWERHRENGCRKRANNMDRFDRTSPSLIKKNHPSHRDKTATIINICPSRILTEHGSSNGRSS